MLTQNQIDKICDYIKDYRKKNNQSPSREQLKDKFCPDVSEYKDKVLICMSYYFKRSGDWYLNKLINKKYWNIIQEDEDYKNITIYLRDFEIPFGEILNKVIDDPYEIYENVKLINIDEYDDSYDIEYDDFMRNFDDMLKYEGQVLIKFKYYDEETLSNLLWTCTILISKEFNDNIIDKTKFDFSKIDSTTLNSIVEVGNMCVFWYEDPSEIYEYISENGDENIEDEDYIRNLIYQDDNQDSK